MHRTTQRSSLLFLLVLAATPIGNLADLSARALDWVGMDRIALPLQPTEQVGHAALRSFADTLYGVTMGGDGVSQVLSLRLSDLPLDEELDVRDLPAVAAGVPVR